MRLTKKILFIPVILLVLAVPAARAQKQMLAHASSVSRAKGLVTEESLRSQIDFLSSPLCEGRGHAQRGGTETAMYLCRSFAALGLQPVTVKDSYSQSGYYDGKLCHNVLGMLPATTPEGQKRYLVVMAHYDGLGVIGDVCYPGADSNASGVAVLLSLAQMFAQVAAESSLEHNILFVGLDAKQLSLSGAYILWDAIAGKELRNPVTGRSIRPGDISQVVNLDTLGGTSAPIHPGHDNFIIMLGGTPDQRGWFEYISKYPGIKLETAYDYYGSKGFTKLFLDRVSDQKPFREKGIPAVMFTSGITMHTNKDSDTAEQIDFPVLLRRTRAIFHWIDRLTYLL